MIKYNYEVSVNENRAKLNKDIFLFRGNRNIHYYFSIKGARFAFEKEGDLIEKTNAINAAVTVIKPNNVEVASAIAKVENGKIHLKVTEDLIDEEVEVGDFDLVFDLFDDTDGAVTIPKVIGQFHVLERPCTTPISELVATNTTNEVDQALTDYAIVTYAEPVASTNADGTFAKKTWVAKEKITTAELNRMEEGISDVSSQCKDIAKQIESGNIGNNVEPALMDMPRVYFSEGTLPTTKTATMMRFDYYSKTAEYHGWAEIKCQGNSSMVYPKKNFTIKLYKDKAKTEKLKIDFKGWGKQFKFVLKANWIDITHARNVVSARIWGDVIKTRNDYVTALPELLRTSPNQGAVDGFPVLIYSNGVYQGRYTLNIPKDKWMSNMDDTLGTHCILCGENYGSGCFRALPKIDGTDWTDELHDVVPDTIKTGWTNAINFVMTSSDTEFKANLSNYFDVNSLIDYLLYSIVSTNLDGFAKNQLYFTYDGIHWIASVYDLDTTWGLWWDGSSFVATDFPREQFQDMIPTSECTGDGNLLYVRLQKMFVEELKNRYSELRQNVLSTSYIIEKFEEFMQVCPNDVIKEDYAETTGNGNFTNIPSRITNTKQRLRSYIVDRLVYCDNYIKSMKVNKPCTNITLNVTSLSFTNNNTQTLVATVTPSDTSDNIEYTCNPTGIVKISESGVVTPLANGSSTITVTCGQQTTTCKVTVTGLSFAVTNLELDKKTLQLSVNTTYTPNDKRLENIKNVGTDFEYMQGIINETTGEYQYAQVTDYCSEQIPVDSNKIHIIINGLTIQGNNNSNTFIGKYDENYTFLSKSYSKNSYSIIEDSKCKNIRIKNNNGIDGLKNTYIGDIKSDDFIVVEEANIPAGTTDVISDRIPVNKGDIIIMRIVNGASDTVNHWNGIYTYSDENTQIAKVNDTTERISMAQLPNNTDYNYIGFKIDRTLYNNGGHIEYIKISSNNPLVIKNVVGSEEIIKATITPSGATNQNVTWTTNNENIELVSDGLNCTVKAKATGSSVVTCTSSDTTNGSISDTCNVTIG